LEEYKLFIKKEKLLYFNWGKLKETSNRQFYVGKCWIANKYIYKIKKALSNLKQQNIGGEMHKIE